jgi:hypothetical protein
MLKLRNVKQTSFKKKKYTTITQGRIQSPRTESVMKYMLSFVTFIRTSRDAQRLNIATSAITFISGRNTALIWLYSVLFMLYTAQITDILSYDSDSHNNLRS